MATAEQIKSLLNSHFDSNNDKFYSIALQIAAHEARQGHIQLANEIKTLVEGKKKSLSKVISFSPDIAELVFASGRSDKFSELIVSEQVSIKLKRIVEEYLHKEKIRKFGLENRRKILLSGPPGTGKTLTATVISNELDLPLYIVMMDKLVTKYMGETSAKLRQIFEYVSKTRGVYLFDEFDAIGSERSNENEVGEMRRVLNSFLQFIELDDSDSFIVSATNNIAILDQALFRRFDDVIHFQLPNSEQIKRLIENRLGSFIGFKSFTQVQKHTGKLSHAEIAQACDDSIKETILKNKSKVNASLLILALNERSQAYG